MVRAERQSLQTRDSQTHNRRSSRINLGALSCGALKNADLVPEGQILQPKGSARTPDRRQGRKQCRDKIEHRERELRNKYKSHRLTQIVVFERHDGRSSGGKTVSGVRPYMSPRSYPPRRSSASFANTTRRPSSTMATPSFSVQEF